ncbi:MAG: hypothetical protein K2X93_17860 [Candidatus Obscuribacterales bacterium]|nr:hypothetical protein [Candidatus Obscuribacterales bacterium]
MKRQTKRKAAKRRDSAGWALVAVMTVSVFATILLFSLAGLSASLLNSEAVTRQRNLALNGAEVGLDYARKLMNESLTSGNPSVIEPSDGETERVTELPSQYVPQLGDSCRVRVRVKRITGANMVDIGLKNSSFIPDQWNPLRRKLSTNWKFGDNWQDFAISDDADAPSKGYFWVVEVTSYTGIFASSVRAILVPDGPDTKVTLDPTPPKDVFFPQGIVADGNIDIGSGFGYMDVASTGEGWSSEQVNVGNPGDPSTFKAVVETNGTTKLEPGSLIYGNLKLTNPSGATNSVLNGDGNSVVLGRVETNAVDLGGVDGSVSGFQATAEAPFPAPSDNVLALGDLWANLPNNSGDFWAGEGRIGTNKTSPMVSQPASTQNQVSPNHVPSGQNSASLPSFPEPPADGSAYVPTDVSVPSGSYTAESIDSSNASAKLVFNDSGPGTPTKIYIDPNTSGDAAVSLSTQFIVNNGDSTDLQIFYAGDKPLNIYLDADGDAGNPNLKAVIFAPNATVNTQGVGEFYGSIVAKNLNINHVGAMQLDPNAARVVADRGGSGGGSGSIDPHARAPVSYRVATWQQISGSLVPLAN